MTTFMTYKEERDALRQQLADTETQRVNWMMQCKRQGDNAQAVINELRQQLAEKDAEIEHLDRTKAEWKNTAKFLDEQLAASQAREQQLREALQDARTADDISYCASGDYFTDVIDAALALPQDITALSTLIAKAGEVMRERCERESWLMAPVLRSIPGVTMEDLEK